jgi:hypothetical protein
MCAYSGKDPEHADRWWRTRVGVMLQKQQLIVRECLELYAGYYPAPRSVKEVIELVGLKNKLFKAFDPATTGSGIAVSDLLILAAWGVGGLLIALWRCSWSPRSA